MDKASEGRGVGIGDGVEVPGESCLPNVDHGSASKVEIKSVTTSQKLKMGFTVTKENLTRPTHNNGKLQQQMTLRDQPPKNMYTEHQQTNVQTATRQTKPNAQKLCTGKPKNKIQPKLTSTQERALDNQDQNTHHNNKNYIRNDIRKTKKEKNKIINEHRPASRNMLRLGKFW